MPNTPPPVRGPSADAAPDDEFGRALGSLTEAQLEAVRLPGPGTVHRGRGRVGQDPGAHPPGGPPHPGRLGRRRPHRSVHLHPQGGPRAPRAPAALRRAGVDPGGVRGGPRARGPGRHPPPAGADPPPSPRPRHRAAPAAGGRAPVADRRRHRRGPGRRRRPSTPRSAGPRPAASDPAPTPRPPWRAERVGAGDARPGGGGVRASTRRRWPGGTHSTSTTSWSGRPTCSTTTPASPSGCTGGTGTSRWTSSRT